MAKNKKAVVVEDLEKTIDGLRARLWEVISENDRLTLTYEPYQPPGDEYEGVQYFDLIAENDTLAEIIENHLLVIRELDAKIRVLEANSKEKAPQIPYPAKKVRDQPKYFGSFAFDYWPPRDWLRFSFKNYGRREWQLVVGPIRIDFMRN